jgi:hypothetical protein
LGGEQEKPPSKRADRVFKSFAQMARETRATGDHLHLWVYPALKFGSVFWIPDETTGFGRDGEHPWVIVDPYRPGRPTVFACPRTSQVDRNVANGLFTPAGVIDEWDRDGVILLSMRRSLLAKDFAFYRQARDLPPEWQEKLRIELAKRVADIATQSEEP